MDTPSQLRQDIVSGDWIVVAPRRQSRPDDFSGAASRVRPGRADCVFEQEALASAGTPLLRYGDDRAWTLEVIENKFPAFTHRNVCATLTHLGHYPVMESVGHHEIVITRGHEDDFPDLAPPAAHEVFSAFRERHEAFAEDECTAYVSIFHNWGKSAGASVYHPHYQLIATPVVPPSISHSLEGARTYFREHKECVHCTIMQSERAHGGRVILENAGAIAFAPFASRTSYTWSIFPTDHAPSFAEATEASRRAVADALRASLRAMRTALHDPDYNFYIHTMPLRERRRYGSYHWHVEVIPKLSNIGGFELSTGIIINAVDPDQAAATIRGALTA